MKGGRHRVTRRTTNPVETRSIDARTAATRSRGSVTVRDMRSKVLFGLACTAAVAALSAACGGSNAGSAVRPADPQASSALGEAPCREAEKYGEPLVVDWPSEQRGDLEVAMHEGVAVVAYSCKAIRLLKDCHADGTYGFIGTTQREQVVKLESSDEVQANLPTLGAAFLSKIGADMQRGAALDIALVTIGKKKTTLTAATTDDLKGTCDGATHFVRGAAVGAFALDTGTRGQVRAAAEIFGASTKAESSSTKAVHNKDGDVGDCKQAAPDSPKPPSQCGAPVRLELLAITAKPKGAEPAPPPPAAKDAVDLAEPEESCPKGLVLSAGKCTAAAQAKSFQCESGKAEECTQQCEKGSAGSCATLGAMYAEGNHVSRNYGMAAGRLKQGCDGGVDEACVGLGALTFDGRGVDKSVDRARDLFAKGCDGGVAEGCTGQGKAMLASKLITTDADTVKVFQRACDGGSAAGCRELGALYEGGRNVPKDPSKALDAYKRACFGRNAESCARAGDAMEKNRDTLGAGIFYQRACWGQYFDGCASLGRLEQAGMLGGPSQAKRDFQQACAFGSQLGCAAMIVLYNDKSRMVQMDIARSQALTKSCQSGVARDCAIAGMWNLATNNPMGTQQAQQACNMGDKFGCALIKR